MSDPVAWHDVRTARSGMTSFLNLSEGGRPLLLNVAYIVTVTPQYVGRGEPDRATVTYSNEAFGLHVDQAFDDVRGRLTRALNGEGGIL
jgi:hypothetical protein